MAWLVRGLPPPLKAASRSSSAPVDLVARWQDELLHAILDVDAGALEQALDTHGAKAIHAVLERREVQKQGVFYIADQMYPKYGALRDVLGGDYWFEDEEQRSAISTWLDMIGAQTGDTMLHLVMRLNGCADEAKVACAVELIGRGMDWEKPNKAGTLAPAGFCTTTNPGCSCRSWRPSSGALRERPCFTRSAGGTCSVPSSCSAPSCRAAAASAKARRSARALAVSAAA